MVDSAAPCVMDMALADMQPLDKRRDRTRSALVACWQDSQARRQADIQEHILEALESMGREVQPVEQKSMAIRSLVLA